MITSLFRSTQDVARMLVLLMLWTGAFLSVEGCNDCATSIDKPLLPNGSPSLITARRSASGSAAARFITSAASPTRVEEIIISLLLTMTKRSGSTLTILASTTIALWHSPKGRTTNEASPI